MLNLAMASRFYLENFGSCHTGWQGGHNRLIQWTACFIPSRQRLQVRERTFRSFQSAI